MYALGPRLASRAHIGADAPSAPSEGRSSPGRRDGQGQVKATRLVLAEPEALVVSSPKECGPKIGPESHRLQ